MGRYAGKVGCGEISFVIVKEARGKADGALMLGSVEILRSFTPHAEHIENKPGSATSIKQRRIRCI